MAKSITIRNIPEKTRDELASRAARSGRSLQEYLRAELIKMSEQPDIETLLAKARERVERAGTRLTAAEILKFRDMGRK